MSNPKARERSIGEMDYYRLFRLLLPKLPLIARVALLHVLRLSEPAKYLDLRSELIVSVLRAFCQPANPRSVSSIQRLSLKDSGVRGRIWVSKYTSPVPPEADIRDALFRAIDSLGDSAVPRPEIRQPELLPVEAEWTGYRDNVAENEALPSISEQEKFAELEKACTARTTILYMHGGAYYLLDPSTHRPTTRNLARLTGGRCFSVRYRLAPQHPFPAALLDAMVSYFTLLYPPPGSFHQPIEPDSIVLAGDSAGGNLCLALLQVILELRRQNHKVTWYGSEREVPLPAGVAVNSPWLDITQSCPSWEANWQFDFLPTPSGTDMEKIPPCDIWPAKPPRQALYVDDAFLSHPLATLTLAKTWKEAPPVFICTGWELLADEDKFMASKLHQDGITVVFEEYEAMPHCFAMILQRLPGAGRCFDSWSAFIKAAVEDPYSLESRATNIKAKSLEVSNLDFASLSDTSPEEMRERILTHIEERWTQESVAKL